MPAPTTKRNFEGIEFPYPSMNNCCRNYRQRRAIAQGHPLIVRTAAIVAE
jgi:hypothetical protein